MDLVEIYRDFGVTAVVVLGACYFVWAQFRYFSRALDKRDEMLSTITSKLVETMASLMETQRDIAKGQVEGRAQSAAEHRAIMDRCQKTA